MDNLATFPSPPESRQGTCLIPTCGKPLGHDSKEQGYLVCQEHRLCSLCNEPLTPVEVKIQWNIALRDSPSTASSEIDISHPRCIIAMRPDFIPSDPTISLKQSTYDILNAARLMVDPDMNLSIAVNESNAMIRSGEFCAELLKTSNPPGTTLDKMEFDAIYLHQKMLEACLAAVSNLVAKQDRKAIKERASAREAISVKAAKQQAALEAKTSTRPAGVPATDANEIELSKFMEVFDIKERKVALDLKKRRDKAIEQLVKIGFPMQAAITKCNEDMMKNRTPVEDKK